jgi:hypothetical protein
MAHARGRHIADPAQRRPLRRAVRRRPAAPHARQYVGRPSRSAGHLHRRSPVEKARPIRVQVSSRAPRPFPQPENPPVAQVVSSDISSGAGAGQMSSDDNSAGLFQCAEVRRASAASYRERAAEAALTDPELYALYSKLAATYEEQARQLDLVASRVAAIDLTASRTRESRERKNVRRYTSPAETIPRHLRAVPRAPLEIPLATARARPPRDSV